ncbi:MAG: hypothetical protein PVF45_03960 [Anaerolineae bacterium]|jgi:CRISPR-associated protein Csm4
MLTFRARLRPRSATLSPWQADILFGHLCWLIRYAEGRAAVDDFLADYHRGRPPLLFSNGFPGDCLPRPLGPAPPGERGPTKAAQVRAMQAAKADKDIRWLSLDEFNACRRGERVALGQRPQVLSRRTVLKNQINRLTGGTTPVEGQDEGGHLYAADELVFVDASGVSPVGLDVSIYVKARDEALAARAEKLLKCLSRSGYGAKKSAGYGHFALASWERFTDFDEAPPDADGFISLSNWTPARGDPTQGFYATMVKYGKLGESLAVSENPFKFPLLMFKAGSSFYAGAPIRDWYGRLVADIAPAAPHVVQYGYAFAVPARLDVEG